MYKKLLTKFFLKNIKKYTWKERAKVAASYLPSNKTILDMGAGKEVLKDYLIQPSLYIPVDYIQHTENIFLIDFDDMDIINLQNLIKTKSVDYIVVLGTLEYLKNKKKFLDILNSLGQYLIISILYDPKVEKACESETYSFIKTEEAFYDLLEECNWKATISTKVEGKEEYVYYCINIKKEA